MKLELRKLEGINKERWVAVCNRISLLLQFFGAFAVNFLIESFSRHSIGAAIAFLTKSPAVFLVNSMIIFMTTSVVYLVRRRVFLRVLIYGIWIFLGIVNGTLLMSRVTPFTGPDFKLLGDAKKIVRNYMSSGKLVLILICILLATAVLIFLFLKGPKFQGKRKWWLDILIVIVCIAAWAGSIRLALAKRVISNYFGNIAFAYQDYGFPYCFSVTLFDTGISEPNGYSEALVKRIMRSDEGAETKIKEKTNVIFVQLESFFDPTTVDFLNMSADPMPNYRQLMKEYSSGYIRVPVVGAGTANTEFESITGMSLRSFGAGEYPYKTVLAKQTCESIPYVLSGLGYDTHAIHNNEANFYGRKSVYKRLGFDTFTSKEYMPEISDQTETGWVKDHYLTDEIVKCLNSTDRPDYIYTVSVQGHGDYPSEPVVENPPIKVTGAEGRAQNNNSWEYYCKQIYEMDQFVKELTDRLASYPERCVVVFYGDHLPTMGLQTENLKNKYLYQTEYLMWDNFGLKRKQKDETTYQIGADVLGRIGIHDGTMVRFHQKRKNTRNYQQDMQVLQYDMLYGDRYVYGGTTPFQSTDMKLGIDQIKMTRIERQADGAYMIYGEHFTPQSKLEINKKLQDDTVFISGTQLYLAGAELDVNDEVDVAQKSSSSTGRALSRTTPIRAELALAGISANEPVQVGNSMVNTKAKEQEQDEKNGD